MTERNYQNLYLISQTACTYETPCWWTVVEGTVICNNIDVYHFVRRTDHLFSGAGMAVLWRHGTVFKSSAVSVPPMATIHLCVICWLDSSRLDHWTGPGHPERRGRSCGRRHPSLLRLAQAHGRSGVTSIAAGQMKNY